VGLVAAYHFLLGLSSLIIGSAIVVYAMLPPLQEASSDLPQTLFPSAAGLLIGFLLCLLYGATGVGLMRMSNSARVVAVFLALFGIVGGIFAVVGAFAGGYHALAPDWIQFGAIGLLISCLYLLTTMVDLIVLVFLLSGRVRQAFYGQQEEGAVTVEDQADDTIPELDGIIPEMDVAAPQGQYPENALIT